MPTIPHSFPLQLLNTFFSRSLRRSLYTQQEASILKNLASGQNLVISERLFEVQEKMGGVVDRGTPGGNEKSSTREKSAVRLEKNGSEEVKGDGEKEITGRSSEYEPRRRCRAKPEVMSYVVCSILSLHYILLSLVGRLGRACSRRKDLARDFIASSVLATSQLVIEGVT